MSPDAEAYFGTNEPYSDHEVNVGASASSQLSGEHGSTVTTQHGDQRIARLNADSVNSEMYPSRFLYHSYAGVDIVATMVLPNNEPVNMGELQTISYSIHRENHPVRILGHASPVAFTKGGRSIAGSMIFTVFNNYAFYRLEHFQEAIKFGVYPVADMLPPVDIVLTFSNEFGIFSKMKLYGITFVDEGGAMSIDDLISEATFSYMARGIQPLTGYVVPTSL